jgi:hypothetical protein
MAISFIKLPRHKRFEYTPRYWDPEKEEREERVRQIKREMGIEVPSIPGQTTIRRGSFRQRQKQKVKATRASNIRLLVILAVLFIIAYLIFLA